MRSIVITGLVLLAVGCIDDFDPPSLVTKSRPLAARVAIEGDLERAWPAAGESVTVTWLMGEPADALPLTWALLACPGVAAPTGDTFCVGEPLGLSLVDAPTSTQSPFVSFTMPPTVEGIERILVRGVICADGTVRVDLDTLDVGCDGADAQESLVSAAIRVADAELPPNHHPSIADDAIRLDDQAWAAPPTGTPLTGCASVAGGPELPMLSVGADAEPSEIAIVPTAGDREPVMFVDGTTGTEALLFSHYSTGGELDRQFTVIDDRNPDDVRIEWTLPAVEEVASDGTRVRFYIVVRDERGGLDFTTRELCAVP